MSNIFLKSLMAIAVFSSASCMANNWNLADNEFKSKGKTVKSEEIISSSNFIKSFEVSEGTLFVHEIERGRVGGDKISIYERGNKVTKIGEQSGAIYKEKAMPFKLTKNDEGVFVVCGEKVAKKLQEQMKFPKGKANKNPRYSSFADVMPIKTEGKVTSYQLKEFDCKVTKNSAKYSFTIGGKLNTINIVDGDNIIRTLNAPSGHKISSMVLDGDNLLVATQKRSLLDLFNPTKSKIHQFKLDAIL